LFVNDVKSGISDHAKGTAVAVLAAMYICYFALCIEGNDSQVANISRQEYVRVMREIINDSTAADDPNTMTYSSYKRRPDADLKHDSFYYLQRSLERDLDNRG
jgi:hypothetical protein